MDNEVPIKYVNPNEMADLLGIKTRQLVRWARKNHIPKLILPNGRFVFNPEAVILALQHQSNDSENQCPAGVAV